MQSPLSRRSYGWGRRCGLGALGVSVSVPSTSAQQQAERVHWGVDLLSTESRLLRCWSGTPAALPTTASV